MGAKEEWIEEIRSLAGDFSSAERLVRVILRVCSWDVTVDPFFFPLA